MSEHTVTVSTARELLAAVSAGVEDIEVRGSIVGAPGFTLAPGVSLRGGTLQFGARGVRLTSDNTLEDISILTADEEAAILNDTGVTDLGTLTLRNVTTRGQIAILAEDRVRGGHVQAENVRVLTADLRGRFHRPHGFGVDVLQGGFTLWNRQADPEVELTAELLEISAGTEAEPVFGSGIFVGGHGDRDGRGAGGTVHVTRLRTGEVHTDGAIPAGTPDLISAGVFVLSGATVDAVRTAGAVTTYGPNDMVLDNWGSVGTWIATGEVASHGPSGIGVVNFGDIDTLDVRAPIVTTGRGARGFNLYDGTLREARFQSIRTTGDGSIGIQISRPMGRLAVDGDVTTSGGEGLSLVKGVQMTLPAIALSVTGTGSVDALRIGGRLVTAGANVVTLEVGGRVGEVSIAGGVRATGAGSRAVSLLDSADIDIADIDIADIDIADIDSADIDSADIGLRSSGPRG